MAPLTTPARAQNPGAVGPDTNISTTEKEAHEGLGYQGVPVGHQLSTCWFVLLKTRFLCAAQADLNLESPSFSFPSAGNVGVPRKDIVYDQ